MNKTEQELVETWNKYLNVKAESDGNTFSRRWQQKYYDKANKLFKRLQWTEDKIAAWKRNQKLKVIARNAAFDSMRTNG